MLSHVTEADLQSITKMKRRCIGRILEAKEEIDYALDDDESDRLRKVIMSEVENLFDITMLYIKQEGRINLLYCDRLDEIHKKVMGDG